MVICSLGCKFGTKKVATIVDLVEMHRCRFGENSPTRSNAQSSTPIGELTEPTDMRGTSDRALAGVIGNLGTGEPLALAGSAWVKLGRLRELCGQAELGWAELGKA